MPFSINGINGVLGNLLSPTSTPAAPAAPAAPGGDFAGLLKQAVSALGALGTQADASTTKLATGSQVDVHEVMLNAEQASLGFNFALQVRNKLVDAYQEVMRMSL